MEGLSWGDRGSGLGFRDLGVTGVRFRGFEVQKQPYVPLKPCSCATTVILLNCTTTALPLYWRVSREQRYRLTLNIYVYKP